MERMFDGERSDQAGRACLRDQRRSGLAAGGRGSNKDHHRFPAGQQSKCSGGWQKTASGASRRPPTEYSRVTPGSALLARFMHHSAVGSDRWLAMICRRSGFCALETIFPALVRTGHEFRYAEAGGKEADTHQEAGVLWVQVGIRLEAKILHGRS